MVSAEDKLVLIETHRDRLWKAIGEIEDRMNSHQKQLEGLYKQKLWIPVHEKRETDPRSPPEYFDGLADWVAFLKPIILGAK